MSVAKQKSRSRRTGPQVRDGDDDVRRLCDALPVLIAHVDGEERYCFNNQAYESWFGLRPRELHGKTMREVLGEEAYVEMRPRIRAALNGEKQVFEGTIRQADGTERLAQIHYIPRLSARGRVDGIYILLQDITEQRRTQEQFRRLNAELEHRVQERTGQLEAANRELEAFCYSVSHDLRAPLRAVRGFTDVLIEQYASRLDARGQDFLRRVSDASVQMDCLVDDLLRLSRVSRTEIQLQRIDLSALAAQILSELKKGDPNRELLTAVEPGLEAEGDERLVRLVMDNLLRNAWKFTGRSRPGRIEFGQEPDNGAFYVRDNGVGFDMAYAHRLFGVFQRLHSAADYPGSGVGLAIAQRVINRHGGRIWAEGRVNGGATFYFTLPPQNETRDNPGAPALTKAPCPGPAGIVADTGPGRPLELYEQENHPPGGRQRQRRVPDHARPEEVQRGQRRRGGA